jgi:hypothetical protein
MKSLMNKKKPEQEIRKEVRKWHGAAIVKLLTDQKQLAKIFREHESVIVQPETEDIKLQKRILQIVDEHSGGMKFTELLVEVLHQLLSENNKLKTKKKPVPTPELLLYLCKRHSQLKVLEYSWIMGKNLTRAKWFVYRPK